MKFFHRKKGFSLVETVVYVSLMGLLVAIITYVISVIFQANAIVKSTRSIENSSIAALDRMVREIRAASSIDASSVLGAGTNYGELKLTIPNGASTRSVRFYLSNERVYVDDNNVQTGPLTLAGVRATSLQFFVMSTSTSKAVKIELVLVGPPSNPGLSDKFYGTAVLRGGYIQE